MLAKRYLETVEGLIKDKQDNSEFSLELGTQLPHYVLTELEYRGYNYYSKLVYDIDDVSLFDPEVHTVITWTEDELREEKTVDLNEIYNAEDSFVKAKKNRYLQDKDLQAEKVKIARKINQAVKTGKLSIDLQGKLDDVIVADLLTRGYKVKEIEVVEGRVITEVSWNIEEPDNIGV